MRNIFSSSCLFFYTKKKTVVWRILILLLVLSSCGSTKCQKESVADGSTNSQHVVILLDKSASMEDLIDDVVAGFNGLVDQLPNSSFVTLFGFESIYGLDNIFDHLPAPAVRELTESDYNLGDGTPLYDAISGAIKQLEVEAMTRTEEKIIFVIISDGLENASIRYSLGETRSAITEKISGGWDIRFYGLGPDAASEAENLGISVADGASFAPNQDGVNEVFDDIAGSFTQSRTKSKCSRVMP